MAIPQLIGAKRRSAIIQVPGSRTLTPTASQKLLITDCIDKALEAYELRLDKRFEAYEKSSGVPFPTERGII